MEITPQYNTRTQKLNALRNDLEAIEASIKALEDEEVAEALLTHEGASKDDLELPTVGYTVVAYGTRYTGTTQLEVGNWLDRHPGIIEEVVLRKDAEKTIKELSDMVVSLGETQVFDPAKSVNSMEGVVKFIDSLPVFVANSPASLMTGTDPVTKVANKVISILNDCGLVGLPMRVSSIYVPDELNQSTAELATGFITNLLVKLRQAEQKYGFTDTWTSPDWMEECRMELRKHLEKGDPLDVAVYAMFLWFHRESTAYWKAK